MFRKALKWFDGLFQAPQMVKVLDNASGLPMTFLDGESPLDAFAVSFKKKISVNKLEVSPEELIEIWGELWEKLWIDTKNSDFYNLVLFCDAGENLPNCVKWFERMEK